VKRLLKILLLLAFFSVLFVLFPKERFHKSVHLKLDADLWISEYVFGDYHKYDFDDFVSFDYPISIWQPNDSILKLPVHWIVNENNLTNLDSAFYVITNMAGYKIYYMTWGTNNSRMRKDFVVHKNGKTDTLLYDGFGCTTGIYLESLADNDTLIQKEINPLLINPYDNTELNTMSDSFPFIFSSLYGDSVSIRFRLPTYSKPWNKYKPQMVESKFFTINTSEVIEKWTKRRK
jgi:hypothetical protein